ncbi:sialidase [uncultured Dokdonia sp.]|uniref:sialidase n=1 Tax=uncultured Dokdonia sp. TaxID=575653 RepID=UPI00262EAAE4|nr:sialidase [uncultured Dokdonia sp.]
MRYFILLCICVVFSCKQKEETPKVEAVQEMVSESLLTTIESPSKGKAHLPRLVAQNGVLHMSWVEEEDSLAILKYASYANEKWSSPKTITSGTNWFVNWADFPALAINGETVLTNILQKSAHGTYDYDIKLNLLSNDEVLKSNFLLNTDGISAEHGFVSMKPYDDGFYVTWLDGRHTKNEKKEDNRMTLRAAIVGLDGTIREDTEIDASVCDCCNTAIGITYNGPVVVYRDRSEDAEEIRDTYIVRWEDGTWETPTAVYQDQWKLNGCPVNGPAIDTQAQDVVVAWFTASKEDPRVLVTFSKDNGVSFGDPIRVDMGMAIGRVDTTFLDDGSALVSWLEPKDDAIALQAIRVYQDGHKDAPITITTTSAERASGFPQLEVIGKTVYIAWTDLQGEQSTIELASFEI